MLTFISSTLTAMVLYLWLTAGSGEVAGSWAMAELVMGAILSVITGLLTCRHVGGRASGRIFNPLRWLAGAVYMVGPFLLEMTIANIDVAYRVITGRIRPGIIRVRTGMKTDTGLLYMANSITLTPGTLSVAVDDETNDLFVHKIYLAPGEETKDIHEARTLFTFNCPAWIRRIAE